MHSNVHLYKASLIVGEGRGVCQGRLIAERGGLCGDETWEVTEAALATAAPT